MSLHPWTQSCNRSIDSRTAQRQTEERETDKQTDRQARRQRATSDEEEEQERLTGWQKSSGRTDLAVGQRSVCGPVQAPEGTLWPQPHGPAP